MDSSPQVLLYDAAPEPARLLYERLCRQGVAAYRRSLPDELEGASWGRPEVAVVVVGTAAGPEETKGVADVLERLVADQVATLVWGESDNIRWAGGAMVEWIAPETGLDEVVGRLSTLGHYVPFIRRLERELGHLHRLGDQLNRYFSEIDQEMRLAGRLQRDFLPRSLPELPGLEFGIVYRPASWVSGDMYDVFRIDEQHVGLFVADAMGHGVAAGLLTMFMRQALVTKQIEGPSYSILSPAQALENLHNRLVRQKLPSCQFVTAAYAILNTQSRELHVARAGHPHPLHVTADGAIGQINPGGGLLGLADVTPDFEQARVLLNPGEKVIFYTDGLEEDFFQAPEGRAESNEYSDLLRALAAGDVHSLVDGLCEHLDHKAGSLHPADDVTVLALEFGAAAGGGSQ